MRNGGATILVAVVAAVSIIATVVTAIARPDDDGAIAAMGIVSVAILAAAAINFVATRGHAHR